MTQSEIDLRDAIKKYVDKQTAMCDGECANIEELEGIVTRASTIFGLGMANACWDNQHSAFDIPWEKWIYDQLICYFAVKQPEDENYVSLHESLYLKH